VQGRADKDLARIFDESLAATLDMGALLSELEALRAGSQASSGVGSCDVPFRYASEPIPRYRGTVTRWPARLALLAWRAGTPIFKASREQFMKHPGSENKKEVHSCSCI